MRRSYFVSDRGWRNRGIEGGCSATIVIGRRDMRESRDGAARRRDLRNDDIEVMSYDRLVERYRECAAWH